MTKTRELFFLDVETTGLNPSEDLLVELSYAPEYGEIKTLYFGVISVPPFIDELTKFTERGVAKMHPAKKEELDEFLEVTAGQTMVSANPKFDAGFLEANKLYNFGYRALDIESYAMKAMRLDYVPGMADIHRELTERGFVLPEPDHSSAGDVRSLMAAYQILKYQF
jgi:hypothetical protein